MFLDTQTNIDYYCVDCKLVGTERKQIEREREKERSRDSERERHRERQRETHTNRQTDNSMQL